MPSPFHQKYSTQNHTVFGNRETPSMPDGPAERRASDASMNSSVPSSPTDRRRSSGVQRYANLHAMKNTEENTNRRASLSDARMGQPGMFGKWWNSFARGVDAPGKQVAKEPRDTTTLSR